MWSKGSLWCLGIVASISACEPRSGRSRKPLTCVAARSSGKLAVISAYLAECEGFGEIVNDGSLQRSPKKSTPNVEEPKISEAQHFLE
jgi:hypothetical protein